VNALDVAAFNNIVHAADGSHAAASNRADRRYAWQRADMDAPGGAAARDRAPSR